MEMCKICGNKDNNRILVIQEMIHGTNEKFDYLECGFCGCLQIVEVPKNMSDYYGNSTYGSFVVSRQSKMKIALRTIRNNFALRDKGGIFARLLNKLIPLPDDWKIIKNYANPESKILDVGCGIGSFIVDLKNVGFKNVSGVDPYLDKDLKHSNGVLVKKKYLEEVDDIFDIILSHHSFEHLPNPLETLVAVRNRLTANGKCLLTIPIGGDLFGQYREACFLIQAPQHYFLHSIKSVSIAAELAGLKIEKVMRESSSTLIWSKYSELWKKGIPSNKLKGDIDKYFSRDELRKVNDFCRGLKDKGDNVTFVLARHS